MGVGERIRKRRKELGMSAEQVADIMGVSPATIYRYESADIMNMRIDKLEPIASALHTSPAYLMGWEELPDNCTPYNPSRRIPILGRISAGLPLYAEEHIEGYTYTNLNGNAEYFALRVEGDSMTASRIYDGDLLIVRRQSTVDNGDIAVVLVNGQDATVKKFYQNGNIVTLAPNSTNPDHQIQMHDIRKIEICVLGKVVKNEISF